MDAIVIWGRTQIEDGLKNAVEVLVGRFCSDYLKANPEDQASPSVDGE